MYDELCNYKEVARILCVSVRTVKAWRASGKLPQPAIQDKRHVWFRRAQIQGFINEQEEETERRRAGNVAKTA